jgi:hypothetical protein
MSNFNGKHNRVVGRCLVLLYDCQQLGGFPNGLTLPQIYMGAGISNDYLMNKVVKWREWDYVVGKPIALSQGRARWHYRIGGQGIRFVESLSVKTLIDIRLELDKTVGDMPDVPLPRLDSRNSKIIARC